MTKSLAILAGLARPYWRLLILGAFGVLAMSAFTLLSASLVGRGLAALPRFETAIWAAFAGAVVARVVTGFMGGYFVGRVAGLAVTDLRRQLFATFLRAPVDFYDRNYSANLSSALTSDAAFIGSAMDSVLPSFARNLPTLLFALVLLFLQNWQLALWLCVAGIPIVAGLVVLGRQSRRLGRDGQANLGQMSVVAQETFLGLRLIKVLTQEGAFRRRFEALAEKGLRLKVRSVWVGSAFNALMTLGSGVALLGGVWLLQRQLEAGETTPEEVTTFAAYLGVLSLGAYELVSVYARLEGVNGALQRLDAIRRSAAAEREGSSGRPVPRGAGLVEFDDVTFRYPTGRSGLFDLSLRIEPGEVVAIVGRNGAGKSTLIHLLLRFYRPQEGVIRLDGCAAEESDLREWRRRFAVVSRDPVIFSLSIGENIGLGRDGATPAEIEAAARAVNLHEVIEALPGGYDAKVGEFGTRLSSGQRQRLALARVFLQDPSVVVFDEATNSLDAEAEQAFTEALGQWSGSRTIILISHQPQGFWPVDRVVRLEAGRLREEAPALV